MGRTITFTGNPLTLTGNELKTGMKAPEFLVLTQDMKEVHLADFKGKVKVVSVFPSLDTPVCDLQVKEFNKRSASFSKDVVVIGVSKDLPFAQKRFCSEHDITNLIVSDYRDTSFGNNYGLLIKELNLLARAVLIIDKNDIVRYIDLAPELTKPPDYDAALKALDGVMK